jgi:hypothetical protein
MGGDANNNATILKIYICGLWTLCLLLIDECKLKNVCRIAIGNNHLSILVTHGFSKLDQKLYFIRIYRAYLAALIVHPKILRWIRANG